MWRVVKFSFSPAVIRFSVCLRVVSKRTKNYLIWIKTSRLRDFFHAFHWVIYFYCVWFKSSCPLRSLWYKFSFYHDTTQTSGILHFVAQECSISSFFLSFILIHTHSQILKWQPFHGYNGLFCSQLKIVHLRYFLQRFRVFVPCTNFRRFSQCI
jgi:hypothetical protein